MASPAQADIVRELYGRRDTLPADKRAVVEELYGRMNQASAKVPEPADFRTIMASPEFQKGAVQPFAGAGKALVRGAIGSVTAPGSLGYLSGLDKKIDESPLGAKNTGEKAGGYVADAAAAVPLVESAVPLAGRAIRGLMRPKMPPQSIDAPYFAERNTYGTSRGPSGAPPPGPVPTGTVNVPPEAPVSGVNTNSPAARDAGGPRASGRPATGTVNVPPASQPVSPGVNTNSAAATSVPPTAATRPQTPFTGIISEGGTAGTAARTAAPAPPGINPKQWEQMPPELQNAVAKAAANRAAGKGYKPAPTPGPATAQPPAPTVQPAPATIQSESAPPRTVSREDSLNRDVAKTLQVGDQRTMPDGSKQVLSQVPIDNIEGDPGNRIDPEKVARFQETGHDIAPELRANPEGGYTIQEGHHRILADVRNGADTVTAWTPQPAQPSPAGFLEAPLSAKDAPDYTQQVMERIAAKAQGTPEIGKHQNAYHVGDVSEHKAINVARQLNDEGVTADEYAAMVKKAQASGNWAPIDQINNRAYASGKAGGYQGYLPKSGYSAVSDARRAERGSYQGISTPGRIIQHLREYDKLRK